MSPDTVAVGIFTIIGTLSGVVVGGLVERLYRSWGRVECKPFKCEVRYVAPDELGGKRSLTRMKPGTTGGPSTRSA